MVVGLWEVLLFAPCYVACHVPPMENVVLSMLPAALCLPHSKASSTLLFKHLFICHQCTSSTLLPGIPVFPFLCSRGVHHLTPNYFRSCFIFLPEDVYIFMTNICLSHSLHWSNSSLSHPVWCTICAISPVKCSCLYPPFLWAGLASPAFTDYSYPGALSFMSIYPLDYRFS